MSAFVPSVLKRLDEVARALSVSDVRIVFKDDADEYHEKHSRGYAYVDSKNPKVINVSRYILDLPEEKILGVMEHELGHVHDMTHHRPKVLETLNEEIYANMIVYWKVGDLILYDIVDGVQYIS